MFIFYGIKQKCQSLFFNNQFCISTPVKLINGEYDKTKSKIFFNPSKNINKSLKNEQIGLTKTYSKSKYVNIEKEEFLNLINNTKSLKVTSRSKGKGWSGVIKLFGWSQMPRSHGVGRCVRKGGATGQLGLGRRMPGTKAPKRMGGKNTFSILQVIKIEDDTIYFKGSVAGNKNSIVKIVHG